MFKKDFAVLTAVGVLLLFAPMAEAQVYQHAGIPQMGPVAHVAAAGGCSSCASTQVAPAYQPASGGCASCSSCASGSCNGGNGCCPTAPTEPADLPRLPIDTCCNDLGPLAIPPLTTRLRYDTPPIGKAVGRPLFGRWTGF